MTKMAGIVKSIKNKEVFRRYSEVKIKLWGGEIGSGGFYDATV